MAAAYMMYFTVELKCLMIVLLIQFLVSTYTTKTPSTGFQPLNNVSELIVPSIETMTKANTIPGMIVAMEMFADCIGIVRCLRFFMAQSTYTLAATLHKTATTRVCTLMPSPHLVFD